jgi:hypothetical protein
MLREEASKRLFRAIGENLHPALRTYRTRKQAQRDCSAPPARADASQFSPSRLAVVQERREAEEERR